ncbi:hypothetical protein OX283_009500 [Flavobacterium sp. SUN052]|uniref:hypothetical protein n=1 Tax=Flavobacterium sp. SUN052 TaxID=3002441 RepID=UPI00237E7D1A|nr:hypothetical protein [Flavobacterium sp. SUN052]MEC4004889.1 hypothetical protein [Flavobacterium sp. SUN052]
MKAELEDLYNKLDIRNIDLKIDPSVTEICKISNQTSSITRSVMYFILVMFLMSILVIINTSPQTWALKHKEILDKKIDSINNQLVVVKSSMTTNKNAINLFKENGNNTIIDSIDNKLNELELTEKKLLSDNIKFEKERDLLISKFIPEFKYPKFPILGLTFDVNDAGLIMGLVFFILLLILYFTKRRENLNTKIAFKSISERYRHETNLKNKWISVEESLKLSFNVIKKLNQEEITSVRTHLEASEKKPKREINIIINGVIMQKYNFCCRKHHYNFLTTNEIFNIPKSTIQSSSLLKYDNFSPARLLLYILSVLPFISYLGIVLNDVETIERVYASYPDLISKLLLIEGALTVILFGLCFGICYLNYNLKNIWDNFYDNNFIFID